MSDRLFVGTHKGLFTLRRQHDLWQIHKVDFLGEPVTMFLADPRDNTLYACLTLGHFGVKLRRSTDDGQTWTECAVPKYPADAMVGPPPFGDPEQAKPTLASLKEIWCLEPGGTDETGRLWAGTIPGGLFRSDDRGDTWQLNEPLWNQPERLRWFGGGKDEPGIHSICVHPTDPQRITIAASCGGVWVTQDGGETWVCRGEGIRADYVPPDVAQDAAIQDVHRLVQCPSATDHFWAQHHNGIFRTRDNCLTWQELEGVKPSAFGFAVCVHPHDPETAWFVPAVKDECRVPVDGEFLVNRTQDGGNSFTSLRNGLPGEHSYDLVYRHALVIDDTGQQLAVGSTTGGLWLTDNAGDDWSELSHTLPMIYTMQFA